MNRSISVVLTAALAAVALAACGGGKQSSSATASPGASPAVSPSPKNPNLGKPEATTAMAGSAMMQSGEKVFTANCSSCHQANGKGQPGVFPPLAGNPVVTGPAAKVISIVKNGLSGKITVNGTAYNGQMPAWKSTLSDKDIAEVVTYIRGSWGNKASAVTASQVSSAK